MSLFSKSPFIRMPLPLMWKLLRRAPSSRLSMRIDPAFSVAGSCSVGSSGISRLIPAASSFSSGFETVMPEPVIV